MLELGITYDSKYDSRSSSFSTSNLTTIELLKLFYTANVLVTEDFI